MSEKYVLKLADHVNRRLEEMCEQTGMTKSKAMEHALALLSIAQRSKKEGLSLGTYKITDEKIDIHPIVGF